MIRTLVVILAAVSLGTCLAAPLFFFTGRMDAAGYKDLLLAATLGWFVCAAFLVARRKSR